MASFMLLLKLLQAAKTRSKACGCRRCPCRNGLHHVGASILWSAQHSPMDGRSENLAIPEGRQCGVEQRPARWAHNPEVGGSNPPPATTGLAKPYCKRESELPAKASAVCGRWKVQRANFLEHVLRLHERRIGRNTRGAVSDGDAERRDDAARALPDQGAPTI